MENYLSNDEFAAISKRIETLSAGPVVNVTVVAYSNLVTVSRQEWDTFIIWVKEVEAFRNRSVEDITRLLNAYKDLDAHCQALQRQINLHEAVRNS